MAQSAPQPLEAPKPPDVLLAAWYRAVNTETVGRANYDALMEKVKAALAEWANRQTQLAVEVASAYSQLNAACGSEHQFDSKEAKCTAKTK